MSNAYDVSRVLALCRNAGKIALNYYDNPPLELKADQTVVTLADKEIEQMLCAEFDRPSEDCYIIGEETLASRSEEYLQKALKAEHCYVIDPIDGTAPYSSHVPLWGISIGYMSRGVILDGAICYPALNRLLITDCDKVWVFTGEIEGKMEKKIMEFVEPPLSPLRPVAIAQRYARHGVLTFPNPIFSWCGCVAVFDYLFQGKLLGFLASAKLWDVAAAFAIMSRCKSYVAQFSSGATLSCNLQNGSFELAVDSPRRWALREPLAIGANSRIVDYLFKHSRLGQPEL